MVRQRELRADVVLEGGGVKGIALVGALSVLTEKGYRFERVAGTSAGAIVGSLLAAGMPVPQLIEEMQRLDYRRFRDAGFLDRLPGGALASLMFENGIFEGRYLTTWLGEHLDELGCSTFASLRLPDDPKSAIDPDERFRLVVMASDVSARRLVALPWDYQRHYGLDPDEQPVAGAVRASMSIPFFYEPVRLSYRRRGDDGRDHRCTSTLVDGGMLSNFPIEVFDRRDGRRPRWPTFGIKLSTREGCRPMPTVPSGPLGLTRAMMATMCGFHDALHIDRDEVRARTIFVDTGEVSAIDFDLGVEARDRLFESGRHAAKKFLDTWDFDTYIATYRT